MSHLCAGARNHMRANGCVTCRSLFALVLPSDSRASSDKWPFTTLRWHRAGKFGRLCLQRCSCTAMRGERIQIHHRISFGFNRAEASWFVPGALQPIASVVLGHADGLPSAPDVWREALLLHDRWCVSFCFRSKGWWHVAAFVTSPQSCALQPWVSPTRGVAE